MCFKYFFNYTVRFYRYFDTTYQLSFSLQLSILNYLYINEVCKIYRRISYYNCFWSGLVWLPSFTWITELSPMFTRMVVMRRHSRNLPPPNRFINFISTRTTSAGVEVSVSTPCRMLAGKAQTVLVFAITPTSECFLERCYSSVWRELWRLQWLLQCFVSTCVVILCIKRKS